VELTTVPTLADSIRSTPRIGRGDPLRVVRDGLIRFVDDEAQRLALQAQLDAPDVAKLVAGILEGSPFLTRLMRRRPDWLLASLTTEPQARMTALIDRVAAVARDPRDGVPAAMPRLRLLRGEAALHIALADCAGLWDVDAVTGALTALADASVAAALDIALARSVAEGDLRSGEAASSGIVVLAMGKHGAFELNYSSDIDLIVLFEPGDVPVSKGTDPLDLAVQVTRDLVRLLQEPTGDGYVFRLDLRLRPDPSSTPIAMPIGAAFSYYETVGQNWERAAMIKARPVAGDLARGRAFLRELQPFIWRKYFDYAAIADIHAMKRQIYAHKGHAEIAVEGHDIKLGRGGIREIEFFVQTQQLVFGGRRQHLRGGRTVEMLSHLQQDGWITRRAVADLSAAYAFLRLVEHRLQMVEDQQTQRLPKDAAGVDALARFCGLTPAAFRRTLLGHLGKVEVHYAKLFEEAPALSANLGNLVFAGAAIDPETLTTLRHLGFTRPELAAETVRGWHFGHRKAVTTERARAVLTELIPGLLEAFGQSSDPDAALIAFDEALAGMPAAIELLSILKQNQAMRSLFAEIFGSAPRLAEIVTRHPHVLDALIDPAFVTPVSDAAVATARLGASLSPAVDFEDFLDRLRYAARAENFVVGAQLLSGVLPAADAGAAYAAVADAAIALSLAKVEREFVERHGSIAGGRIAVLGLGKLGSRELTASSDLDLVVVCDHAVDPGLSDGARPLYPADWFARLTQRLISTLTVPTRAGALYAVDLRLRPHGNKGPLVATLPTFRSYYQTEAESWELMALTRARVICGDETLLVDLRQALADCIAMPRDGDALRHAAAEMRQTVRREKPPSGPFDMKLSDGGLFDIEFIAQVLVLTAGGAIRPSGLDTGEVIEAARREGALAPAVAERLVDAWQLQSALMQVLRLCLTGEPPEEPRELSKSLRRRLANAVALPDFQVLQRALADARAEVGTAFAKTIGRGKEAG